MTHVTVPADPRAAAEPRPSSVQALAFVGTCLGLAGIFGMAWRAFEAIGGGPGERTDILGAWPVATALAGVALSALLLVGGLGAFRLRPAARATLMAASVGCLLVGAVALFLYIRSNFPAGREDGMFNWGGMGALFEVLFWPASMLFALYALYTLTRPHVRAAFAAGPVRSVDEGRP